MIFLPLVAAAIAGLFWRHIGDRGAQFVTCAALLVSMVLAWIVFFDESAVSLIPPVRRTWSPRGHTPILRHRFGWKKASMAAALGYRAWQRLHSVAPLRSSQELASGQELGSAQPLAGSALTAAS